jgi:hypothetical protein
MNFPAASRGVSRNDTVYPNPDKPELKIEDLWYRSRSAGACAACRSVFSI